MRRFIHSGDGIVSIFPPVRAFAPGAPDPASEVSVASIGSILAEMKRRRVFRVLAGYCAAALVAIEAANNIFPAISLPAWSTRLVVVLALLGLPVALILAWAFDVTPAGLARDPGEPDALAEPRPARRGMPRLALYVGVALVVALGGAAAYARFGRPAAARGAGPSVAVLPFVNMSGDPANEYFSDGITEEILNALANVPGLRVPARTSSFAFKGKTGDVAGIGRQLRVTHVLEGSVQRAGDRVRITAQLVDARSGYHRWSRAWTLEPRDLFAVEDQISREVARELQVSLEPGAVLAHGGTEDPRAHDLYLQGRALLFAARPDRAAWKANLLDQVAIYRRALEVDSTYALAWSALADTYATLADDFWPPRDGYPRARQAALRALALDADLPEAHNSLAMVLYYHDWDYAGGDRELRRALSLDPDNVPAHLTRFTRITTLNRFSDAAHEWETITRLEPAIGGVWVLVSRAQGGEAVLDSLRRELTAHPNDLRLKKRAYTVALWSGAWREAAPLVAVLQREAPGWTDPLMDALILARAGDTAGARRALDAVVAGSRVRYVRASQVAAVYAALGDHEEALRWLDRAYQERDGTLLELHYRDWWDPLRGDPRFEAIKRRVPSPPPFRG